MCPPMTVASYRDINEKLHDIYISAAEAFKKDKKMLRGVKKGFINKENDVKGGKSYSPGKY